MINSPNPRVAVIGSLNMDLVTAVSRFPGKGETILGEKFSFCCGGKGANQAVALGRLKAQTAMIGAVGQDSFGVELMATLQGNNVDANGVKVVNGVSTGVASITLTKEDNSIIVVAGANDHCLPTDIEAQQETIAQCDIVLLQLEIPLETVCYGIQMAKNHQKKVILNPAPAREIPPEVLKQVDYITPNATELSQLTGIKIATQGDLEKAMQSLLDMGVKNVITTLGAAGVAYITQQGKKGRVAAHSVDVVDTIGAGDAFNAGLAFALVRDKDLQQAISFANCVAALAVSRQGAQTGMPYLEEVEKFMVNNINN